VTVTLPFHPLAGRRLWVLGYQRGPRGLELIVGGPLWRAAWSLGVLSLYLLVRQRLTTRGQVRWRTGLRFLFLVISAIARARSSSAC
jgi:hypothetical protein